MITINSFYKRADYMERLFFPVTQKKASQAGLEHSSVANKKALFPTQLRDLRKEKGVSQEELSYVLGVSKSTIGLWETGDTLPDAGSLHDLAVYYGVSADYLLGLSDIKTNKAHPRVVCELTGLSEEAFKAIWAISCSEQKYGNRKLKDAMNEFLSNKKFVSLMMELKSCITESENVGAEVSKLSSYADDEFPSDPIDLLNYAKEKWDYRWDSGERYHGFNAGFDVVEAEEKRGYSLFSCQNTFMEIIKEISETEIRGMNQK